MRGARAWRHPAALMLGALALPVIAAGAGAQATTARDLADRVTAVGSGTVHLSFTARPGVCGNGSSVSVNRRSDEWESECESGPVRVSLTLRDGRVTALRSYVGGRWRAEPGERTVELGMVPAPVAADYLLGLAERGSGVVADDAVFPATLADSVTLWPRLLRLARDESRPVKARQSAVFWVGQAAGEAATRGLTELVDEQDADLAVRERAVFALSQRPAEESVPALIRVARTSPSPRLRQRAIFWLGQSRDDRALAFFEEVLGGR